MLSSADGPPAHLNVDYESQDAKDNSEYQVCWSKTMDEGPYKNPSTYKKAKVLMLRWDGNCDDLKTEQEVGRLESVLRERFNYETHLKTLTTKAEQGLQVQLNAIVAEFVSVHDGPHTLLIVYYAGHGRPGDFYGALEITNGRSSINAEKDVIENIKKKKRMDQIVWNQTEGLLYPAQGDVLEIFDCCHAGSLGPSRGYKRPFEYLAATQAMAGTPVPGPDSFTSALIHALEYLVEHKPDGRFTTVELLRSIKHHSPDFPKDQFPVLSDREDMGPGGRIMLHPLQIGDTRVTSHLGTASPSHLTKRKTITLHFEFDEKPTVKDVRTLGMEMNSIFEQKILKVNCVHWGGMKPSMTARAVERFLDIGRRGSMKRDRLSVTVNAEDGSSSQQSPEPQTPSPSGLY